MPFLPMRPKIGTPLRTKTAITQAVKALEDDQLLVQPAPTGMRVCLAVVDKNVFIQDQAGHWVTTPPRNGYDFLKLPNNTCLDGYIAHGEFYAADCVAVSGNSLMHKTAGEREAVAYQLVKFLKHRWLFARPNTRFIRAARTNLPDFQGLVLKDYMSLYALLSSPDQTSKEWIKRMW
jgi:hypothetical protein